MPAQRNDLMSKLFLDLKQKQICCDIFHLNPINLKLSFFLRKIKQRVLITVENIKRSHTFTVFKKSLNNFPEFWGQLLSMFLV